MIVNFQYSAFILMHTGDRVSQFNEMYTLSKKEKREKKQKRGKGKTREEE